VFVVDTNLLLYASHRRFAQHRQASSLLERWRREAEPWFATWGILYEYLRVSTHRRVLERPISATEAWSFLESLLASPHFGVLAETEIHARVLSELVRQHSWVSGNLLHDFHTAALMREHGITEIRSADSDFRKFGFLRVVNPLEG
jgi:toxin-antitoxin system PIN domain toxin